MSSNIVAKQFLKLYPKETLKETKLEIFFVLNMVAFQMMSDLKFRLVNLYLQAKLHLLKHRVLKKKM